MNLSRSLICLLLMAALPSMVNAAEQIDEVQVVGTRLGVANSAPGRHVISRPESSRSIPSLQ